MKRTITLLAMAVMVGISAEAVQPVTPLKRDTTKKGVSLRQAYNQPLAGGPNATYMATRPATPLATSIWVDRDAAIHNYTPTDLVRNILLNSHSEADKARIQNVEHTGWNWNETTKQWVSNARVPDDNVWGLAANPTKTWSGMAGVVSNYDANERSLAYFNNGDPAGFQIDSGLIMGTGPILMAEGPNITNHGLNDGMTNNKATHPTLANKNTMHGVEEFGYGTFTSPGAFYRKHQPGGPWNPDQSFDRDLDNLTSDDVCWTTCGSVLEFDFQPAITQATFDYVWASDEYPEGVYSANDVFGFFVSGPYDTPPGSDIENTTAVPSISDPTTLTEHTKQDSVYYRYNIARLPDGKPVGIDYVNWGIGDAIYTQTMSNNEFTLTTPADYFEAHTDTMTLAFAQSFYRSSVGYDATPGISTEFKTRVGDASNNYYYVPTNPELFRYNHTGQNMMEYDGYTVKLQAKADSLKPGKWYHLKLALAQTVQKNTATNYVLDNNHGSGVFLANLELGYVGGNINEPYNKTTYDKRGFDEKGAPFLYSGCPCDANGCRPGNYEMTIKPDTTSSDNGATVIIKYIGIPRSAIQNLDGTPLFTDHEQYDASGKWECDTIQLIQDRGVDTLKTYQFQLSTDFDGFENGMYVGITAEIQGMTPDTVFYSPLYQHATYKLKYIPKTNVYAGKIEVAVTDGSPQLLRSMNDGLTWELASTEITKSQVANFEEDSYILMREVNSCYGYDTLWVRSEIFQPLMRPITMPVVPGTITDPADGIHYVESHDDFVFTITPTGSNVGLVPVITTGRKLVPDDAGVIITRNEDGSYTVTIRQVQEPIDLSISWATGNAIVDSQSVWADGDQLHITAKAAGSAKVYTVSGTLYQTIYLTAGETSTTTLPTGFYIVTMSDGTSYKITSM